MVQTAWKKNPKRKKQNKKYAKQITGSNTLSEERNKCNQVTRKSMNPNLMINNWEHKPEKQNQTDYSLHIQILMDKKHCLLSTKTQFER